MSRCFNIVVSHRWTSRTRRSWTASRPRDSPVTGEPSRTGIPAMLRRWRKRWPSRGPSARGPVDYVLIEFPGDRLTGRAAEALLDLVDRGIVSVYDVIVVGKDAAGLDLPRRADASRTPHSWAASPSWRGRGPGCSPTTT